MERVNTLLAGGTVITMNSRFDIIHDGALAVQGSKIVAVGSRADIEARYAADERIDCAGKYILPGLINAHTHVPMTLLRGMADDLRLDVWLMGYVMPIEREFVSPEFCRLGTLLACAEMIRGGVTTFADMYYFEADIASATAEAGLRAVLGETVLKFPAPDAATYEESLDYTRNFIKEWGDHERITPTVAPHAPYSNTDETLASCAALAREFDVTLLTHIAETRREVDDNQKLFGKTVVPWVRDVGLLDAKVLAAHCVHIDEHEMRLMKKHNTAVVHCPSANLKLASGIAPVAQMLEIGLTVAIGTDGPASNNDLDMFEEMRLAALVAKVTPNNPTALPAKQALQMATINGAKALGLDAVTGSLEEGKFADVIVVDSQSPHIIPHFDFNPEAVYSQIVYAAKSHDVQHVLCHGQVLMRDRLLLTVDIDEIRDRAAEYAERVGAFIKAREDNVLSKLVAVSVGVERGESFEVQVKAVLRDSSVIEDLLSHEDVEVMRAVHYRQYDTYFLFDDPEKGRVRYREDDKIDANGDVQSVRMRLTYTGAEKERAFHSAVLLSHSRFIAPAANPLRFYREYFNATREETLEKERRRWRIAYKGVLFFINVDRLIKPALDDMFIEIKSRTWSLTDAEQKAAMIQEMMKIIRVEMTDIVEREYLEMKE